MFEGAARIAVQPVRRWRNGSRAPQCLIEESTSTPARGVRTYLLTARGFSAGDETEIWLQALTSVDRPRRLVHRAWRAVAGRPF